MPLPVKQPTPCFDSLSQEQMAEAHAVSVRTIRTWTGWGMPRNEDGTYSVPATWKWRLQVTDAYYGWEVSRTRARDLANKQQRTAQTGVS